MIVTEREREREAETQADSMHREPDVGLDPGSPGSCPGPKAGAKPLRHPGIPRVQLLCYISPGLFVVLLLRVGTQFRLALLALLELSLLIFKIPGFKFAGHENS